MEYSVDLQKAKRNIIGDISGKNVYLVQWEYVSNWGTYIVRANSEKEAADQIAYFPPAPSEQDEKRGVRYRVWKLANTSEWNNDDQACLISSS